MTVQTLRSAPHAVTTSKSKDGWFLLGCLPPVQTLAHVKIDSPTFVIGRRPESDLQIASQTVSARHAEILQIGPHLFLRDLGSTNGTFLNRSKVKQPTPLAHGDHIEVANVEFRVEFRSGEAQDSHLENDMLRKTSQAMDVLESNWILSQFHELMQSRAITPSYQPIIDMQTQQTVGYESLARTSLVGLQNPAEMFRTAEMVNQQVELSLLCRQKGIEMANWIPRGQSVFVNTHPQESLHVDVLPSLEAIHQFFPSLPLVVEIHEGSIHDLKTTQEFSCRVRDLGYKIAYDDFGAGQSRLLELVKAPPDYLKFDACLIRDIQESNPYQRRMLKMLLDMCHDVPIMTLAEGIEHEAEADVCRELGFDFGQGYLFGRPLPGSAYSAETN